jgi:hypothetical protein
VRAACSILRDMVLGKGDASKRAVLAKLGAMAQGDIHSEIRSLRTPPNSPVTIALKGSSNPLIDSSEMYQAVLSRVED